MSSIIAATLLVATLLPPMVLHAEQIEVWGSTTCQKRFLEPGNSALAQATGVSVKVKGVGTGKGMLALFSGKTGVAAASNTLEGAIKSAQKVAKKKKQSLEIPADLQFHEIARDEIVPIVNKDNPVTSLTWEQLAKINTGQITNWNQVGGPDLAIRVVTSHAGSATRAVFQKLVMKKEDYVGNAKVVNSTRREIQEVSKYRGAIGAVSVGFFQQNPGKTAVVQTDSISRPLGLITLGDPSPAAQKVIDFYLSEAGQKLVQ